MTVNQRVAGSSPAGGASHSKGFQDIETLFLFIISETFPKQASNKV
jgi:hypothetical protein